MKRKTLSLSQAATPSDHVQLPQGVQALVAAQLAQMMPQLPQAEDPQRRRQRLILEALRRK